MIYLKIAIAILLAPLIVYYCVKFGTVGYYKAKQFIEKENR